MEEEYEEDAEEKKTFLALINPHVRRELGHLLLALQELQNLGKPDHSNQLVQFTDPGKACQDRGFLLLLPDQQIEWQD